MKKMGLYIRAARPQFFTAMVLPVMLGAATAWRVEGVFRPGLFLLSLVAAILYHAAVNVLNDYFDHLNGTDDINRKALFPFTGGSRMIQDGLIGAGEMLVFGSVLLAAGTAVGLYLAYQSGVLLLVIGMAGFLSGVLYSAPFVFLAGRGLGEVAVGLNFGVLAVSGSYYVQTGTLAAEPIMASLPLVFLVAAILYINEFPDYEADMAAGKRNLVVRLGPRRARWGLACLMGLSYSSILAGVGTGLMSPLSLVSLVSVFFAVRAVTGLFKNYEDTSLLVPSIKAVIMAHMSTGALLVLSQVIGPS